MLFGKLLPTEGNFFVMFNQHADRIVEAAHAFSSLVANYNDPALRDKYNQEVDNAERGADRVTHECNVAIHKTFITPIDREYIYSLANTLDDIVDMINSMSNRIKLYKLNANEEYMVQFSDTINQSAHALCNAVKHMHDTKRTRRVLDHCIEVNRLENIGDQIREKAISHLFETEKDPIMVIKWKEIYEVAEGTLDTCEHVAKVIESILVKNG